MRSSPLRHGRTALVFVMLLGGVALLGGQRSSAVGAVTMQRDFAGLVEIGGGRRLYLECRGAGSPTVVLEGGSRSSARYWTDDLRRPRTPRQMVMPAVAGFTRVCAYDRPGTYAATDEDPDDIHISCSDAVPQPRTAPSAVTDLRALLQAAGVPGPYVLAGHSIGGMLSRLYASTYPDEVVGIVLIDSYSERLEFHMTPAQWQGLVRLNAELGVDTIIPIPGYGDAEVFAYAANDAVMRQAVAASPLRPMPLAVLAHGVPFEIPAPPAGFASGDELEAALQAAQADLATLVPRARFVVAGKSGHDVHQDQPELVIEAIRQVVEGVRHPDTWYDLDSCCAAAASATAPESTARATGLKPIDPAALRAAVSAAAGEMLVPGAVVLLRTPQGEVVVDYGTTELGAALPPSAGTHFRAASNTKTMTAAVIMQLAGEGKLRLSDPVARYVPGVPDGETITIAELLEMRSGLYSYTDAPELSTTLDRDPTKVWTADEILAIAFARPANFAPGAEYEYNNTNYALLGVIAERVDGRPLAQVMQARLFGPLGLKNTELPAPTVNAIPEPYTHGYLYGSAADALFSRTPYSPEVKAAARAGTLRPTDFTGLNHSFAEGAGGVISTAGDLATWIEALVGGRVLDAATQRRWLDSLRPEDPAKPDGQQYGYGIAQLRWASNAIYFHGGETPGYNSFMGHDPVNQVTLVVWTNLTLSPDGSPTANALMVKVLDQIYAVSPLAPPSPPTDSR